MSSAGSSPSSRPVGLLAASGGRSIGSRTKYVAPAASRIPRISSSIEPVELSTQALELLWRGVRDRGGRRPSSSGGGARPPAEHPHQDHGGNDKFKRRD